MSAKIIDRPKRSIELTKAQLRFLKDTLKKHNGNKTEAGLSLGISKDVFDRTIAFGSCSEKTYKKLFSSDTEDSTEILEETESEKTAA